MGQFCDPNVIFLEGVITKSKFNCEKIQLGDCCTCKLLLDSLSSILSFVTASPLMIVIEFMSNGSLDNYLKVSVVLIRLSDWLIRQKKAIFL